MTDKVFNIGGVQFNKNDVKKSEVINKDGQEINSVFLRDGTHVEFPTQNKENDAKVSVEEILKLNKSAIGFNVITKELAPNKIQRPWVVPLNDREIKTGDFQVKFERIDDAVITGTKNKDSYNLEGCKNSIVDLSQQDNNTDKVKIKKSVIFDTNTGETTKVKSSGNIIIRGEKGDKIIGKCKEEKIYTDR